jgi:predicted ester cyclase
MTAPNNSANKRLVHRLVDEVINRHRFDLLDDLASDRLAPKLRAAFEQFQAVFPDWHQAIVQLVEEGDTVVARFRCTGTQQREWQGITPTGRSMDIDEVSFITCAQGRITRMWGLEDTWTRMRQLAGENATLGELGSFS